MDGKQVINKVNPTGTGKFLNEKGEYETPSNSGFVLTEVEIDFGNVAVSSKKFNITNASVNTGTNLIITTSSNPATDRKGNDWELDMPFFSTVSKNGSFDLSVVFNHRVKGKRKINYIIT